VNQEEAKRIIEDTFRNSFDEARFRLFAKNLFNDLDESKAFSCQGAYIPDAYKDHVRQYKRLGKFTDPEGRELDVLVVSLKKETALDRARTMQKPGRERRRDSRLPYRRARRLAVFFYPHGIQAGRG
jgi:hypothetical protein